MNTSLFNLRPKLPPCESEVMSSWDLSYGAPVVSILCLSYNHGEYIEDTLNSFLSQKTKYAFEIIVHDDSSLDRTQSVIAGFAKRYPNIIFPIFQINNQYRQGINLFSIIFPVARGLYIAYCEGDDYWVDEHKIELQVSFLMQNKDFVMCYTNAIAFFEDKIILQNFGGATSDLSQAQLMRSPGIYTLTTCFKNVVKIPPECCMAKYSDKFLWSLLGHHGKGKFLDNIRPSMYRVHSGGIHSSATSVEQNEMNIQTSGALFSYYKRIGNADLKLYFLFILCEYVLRRNGISPRLIKFMKIVSSILSKINFLINKL